MGSELREFIESHCKLHYRSGCAFFEFKNDKEDINERKEVLFMDKVSPTVCKYFILYAKLVITV